MHDMRPGSYNVNVRSVLTKVERGNRSVPLKRVDGRHTPDLPLHGVHETDFDGLRRPLFSIVTTGNGIYIAALLVTSTGLANLNRQILRKKKKKSTNIKKKRNTRSNVRQLNHRKKQKEEERWLLRQTTGIRRMRRASSLTPSVFQDRS